MTPEIQALIQWALLGLAAFGYVVLWRMDTTTRTAKRIHREHERAVDQLKKYAADWGQLNERRAATNARYDDTVTKMRDKFGIKENS